jgi:hypothetical protein
MSDEEDELRRMLAARADRVHSTLSGPAIRARAQARRPIRRYAPVLTAAAVLAVVVTSLVLLQRGGSAPEPADVPPAVTSSIVPSPTTTVQPLPSSTPITPPQTTVTTKPGLPLSETTEVTTTSR